MTYSNGQYNPNPLANPFNTRLGYSNYSLNSNGLSYSGNTFNSTNKSLPDPIMLGQLTNTELHTPDTTPIFNFRLFQANIDLYSRDKSWNDNNIYGDILNNTLDYSYGMSRNDIAYWNKANLESAKLSANMSDEQKQMMAEINNMFPPSKFEDEN